MLSAVFQCKSINCVPANSWEQNECTALRDKNYVTVFDSRIDFDESSHTYYLDGQKLQGSSTGFIHSYFNEFDADDAIRKMRNGKKWNQDHKYYDWTDEEIKKDWERNRDNSATSGTRMHELIEWFYNGLVTKAQLKHMADEHGMPELLQFLEFQNKMIEQVDVKNGDSDSSFALVPFRTELRVFYEPPGQPHLTLAGSVDMLYYECPALARSDLDLVLCDWKRSKEIKYTSYRSIEKGRGPCSHLDDCNFNHYSLQLNLYQWMIQRKTPYRITRRFICVFHPNQHSFQMLPVADMQETITKMMMDRCSK